jgi:hypothetical protein
MNLIKTVKICGDEDGERITLKMENILDGGEESEKESSTKALFDKFKL